MTVPNFVFHGIVKKTGSAGLSVCEGPEQVKERECQCFINYTLSGFYYC